MGSLSRAGNFHTSSARRRRRRGSEPAHARQMPRGTPTPLARPRSSGRGGSPTRHNTRCTLRPPPASPAHLKGGKKKKKKSQGAKLPKRFPRGGKSAEQGAQSLKGDVTFLVRSFLGKKRPLLSRPNSTKVTCHVPGANSTPTPSTSGVGISI